MGPAFEHDQVGKQRHQLSELVLNLREAPGKSPWLTTLGLPRECQLLARSPYRELTLDRQDGTRLQHLLTWWIEPGQLRLSSTQKLGTLDPATYFQNSAIQLVAYQKILINENS
jgi:hypothetical protein